MLATKTISFHSFDFLKQIYYFYPCKREMADIEMSKGDIRRQNSVTISLQVEILERQDIVV